MVESESILRYYSQVIGWEPDPVEMNGYHDFSMNPPKSDTPVAGICHARGPNADHPPQWILYITVADLHESMKRCREGGGSIVTGPKGLGKGRYCVMRDPAGAVAALYQHVA